MTITILFLLTFKVKEASQTAPTEQQSQDSYLRDRFAPVLLETTTDCDGKTIRELLSDCAFSHSIVCSNEESSCNYSGRVIQEILRDTLDKYGFNYSISISKEGSSQPVYSNNDYGCAQATTSKTTALNPFQTDFGRMIINLTQCT